MHKILEQFNTGLPFPDIFPPSFAKALPTRDYFSFRNFPHFCHVMSKITQKENESCNMTYEEALRRMLAGETDMPKQEQIDIRNLVRENLFKRGMISEEVYEEYRYTVDGTVVGFDVAKFAAGEPDCVISPARQYIDYFYELYISISYPWTISNADVRKHCAKLLATIEELERQHIFIKIAIVFPDLHAANGGRNLFADIPLFSHKDPKSVDKMSAVINDRLLRKFFFALLENYYGDDLAYGYGQPVPDMKGSMNIGYDFDEIEFFQEVVCTVGAE